MKRSNISRKKNKAKRNEYRKRNYSQSRPVVRKNRPWTQPQMALILSNEGKDKHFSIIFNRSVQAIQQKRYKLKKEMMK